MSAVDPEALRRFARRDWSGLAAAKDRAWLEAKRDGDASDALRSADELRRYVRRIRPDWPARADREEDLQTHIRVLKALGAVSVRSR